MIVKKFVSNKEVLLKWGLKWHLACFFRWHCSSAIWKQWASDTRGTGWSTGSSSSKETEEKESASRWVENCRMEFLQRIYLWRNMNQCKTYICVGNLLSSTYNNMWSWNINYQFESQKNASSLPHPSLTWWFFVPSLFGVFLGGGAGLQYRSLSVVF